MYATDAFPMQMARDEDYTEVFEQQAKDETLANLLESANNPNPHQMVAHRFPFEKGKEVPV